MTLYAYIAIPFILVAINYIFWAIYMLIAQCKNPDIGGLRFITQILHNRVAITFGISMFLIYPQITSFLLQSTNCFRSLRDAPEDVEIEDEIIYRLRMSPDIICSDSKYWVHLLALIIPSLLFLNLVVPVWTIYHVKK